MKRYDNTIKHYFSIATILIILYLYVYNPVLVWLGFGFVAILMPISLLYFILEYKESKLYIRLYRKEFTLSIVCVLYLFIIYSINGKDSFSIVLEHIKYIICNVFVPIFLIKKILSKNRNFCFFDSVVVIGFIASLISCFALFSPSFNAFLRSIMTDRELDVGILSKQLEFRSFGFSGFLISAYGYVQGLIAAYCILYYDKKHKYYLICIITLLVSILINARTGIFPIILALLFVVVKNFFTFNLKVFISFFVVSFLLYSTIFTFLQQNGDVYFFVADFFNQLDNMIFKGNAEDTPYIWMLKFPETGFGLFFGEGRSLFYDTGGDNSDIGYVNQIFMGGLVFVMLLIFYEYILYKNIKKRSSEKVFSLIYFLSILVFNYKGVAMYGSNPYIRLWTLYYFILVHNQIFRNKAIRIA